ncbi:MAG: 5'/3'-nucleotidase SurE [Rikenellaceae bacterium]|nr:5'/3'-nucleotidase SurE [Rikenellaceae bacterium]MDE7133699.1 5'/3'-nucleotidase SurE [Rikenellaceae bacterium]MDE7355798.1 5'/3'-nucleotidase SurE [Rikenellaceae bacterium]
MEQNILITNDDGVSSKGLRALTEEASRFGRVTVVAPEHGMSGMSHAITMANPLYLRKVRQSDGVTVYACQGTPVDCVKIAIDHVMKNDPPTLVLSGINHGSNSNISVIYSGTMGAATEGCSYGIPSIGFSLITHDVEADLMPTRHYVRKILEAVLEHNDNPSLCLNVNVPVLPLDSIKGIRVCRQTKGHWREAFEKKCDPRGREYYWLTGSFVNLEPEAGDNDESALAEGYVSVVPVKVDLTDYRQIEVSKGWF